MALQAQGVDVVPRKQSRVRRSVRKVTGSAAFKLDRRMFIDKRAGVLSVAFYADGVLIRARPEQLVLERSVGIMAIGALHQPFRNSVMKRLCKCSLDIGMAAIAELRLRRFEHVRFTFKGMHAVAAKTAYSRITVGRSIEIRVFPNVTAQAFRIDLFRSGLRELEDLCRNAARFHMGFARPMAAFACHAFAVVFKRQLRVRAAGKGIHLSLVADGAGVRTDIAGRGSWGVRALGNSMLGLIASSGGFDRGPLPK